MDVCLTAAGVCVLAVLWTGLLWTGSHWAVCVCSLCVWSVSLWTRVPWALDLPVLVGLPLVAVLSLALAPVLAAPVLLSSTFKLIQDLRSRRLVLITEEQTRAVLITGCDSGFGLVLAQRLAQVGVSVFAGVLDVSSAGAECLRARGDVCVVELDVTDKQQLDSAHRMVSTQVGGAGLWGLVNNAGVLHCPADAELLPLAAATRCMEVNFLSAVRVCQRFLPLLRRARGRIVNVSSLAASAPMPMVSAYAASKAALSVFSHTMRAELSDWGVTVALIQPGGFRTNIFGSDDDVARHTEALVAGASAAALKDYGMLYVSSLPGRLSAMSRDSARDLSPVTDAMMHALLSVRPRATYSPGGAELLLALLHRHCPAAVYDIIIKALTKHHVEPAGRRTSWDTPTSSSPLNE